MDRIAKKISDKYIIKDFKKYAKLMRAWWWVKRQINFIPHTLASSYLVWRFPFLKYSSDKGKVFHKSCWFWMLDTWNNTFFTEALTGWRKSFGIQMCKELKAALKRHGQLHTYHITDVKEKWGALNIYDDGAPEEVHDILLKYEYISSRTCIRCGRRAKYMTKGYILPFCEDCMGQTNWQMGKEEFYQKDLSWYGWTK